MPVPTRVAVRARRFSYTVRPHQGVKPAAYLLCGWHALQCLSPIAGWHPADSDGTYVNFRLLVFINMALDWMRISPAQVSSQESQ
jgi:hypothetical protein